MQYDIIFIIGEKYFDHPLSGIAILKHLLEKKGYKVGIIEQPIHEKNITKLGKPNLFFGISSGSIDSMVRNYTPLKKLRKDDKHLDYNETVPDRAITVYSNWIRKYFKDTKIVLGGIEATLRRFTHYDYWQNRLRKSILLDTRADILAYGMSEKQILEIAHHIKTDNSLERIRGTCILSKNLPDNYVLLPSHDEVQNSKEAFCDMQNLLSVEKNIVQKQDTRYLIQYKMPEYTSEDIDEYYELPFTRIIPKELRGFQFSIVTHRGCIGNCNFCSLRLTTGCKIISRSEKSILKEIESLTNHPMFKGQIDDLSSPSPNMYGLDCNLCKQEKCISCVRLDRTNHRFLELLREARKIKGIKKINIRSGIRYDLATPELIKEILHHHTYDFIRIAPEHTHKNVLKLMNKDKESLQRFISEFKKIGKESQLSYYFMTAHPGETLKETKQLAEMMIRLKNTEHVQIFTPTPMTVSTCMYYTGLEPKTKEKIHVPYTYNEKKQMKRMLMKEQATKRK
jgi:uncharacterized radical SAM protein YgiQ